MPLLRAKNLFSGIQDGRQRQRGKEIWSIVLERKDRTIMNNQVQDIAHEHKETKRKKNSLSQDKRLTPMTIDVADDRCGR